MGTPSAKKLLAWAKKGDVDALLGLCDLGMADEDGEGDGDGEGDMLAWSSFKFDDGALVQGLIHLELGQAYLSGADGLAKDEKKARAHLEQTDAAKDFPKFRKKIGAEHAKIFSQYFPEKKKK